MGVAVMPPIMHSSAASALLQLDEPEVSLQCHALEILNALADSFWPEISPFVLKIQELSENSAFPDANLAALVAAKVLFHLGDLDEALVYALRSGDLFDVSGDSEFANTLRAKCIDEYSKFQLQLDSGETLEDETKKLSLEEVVERVLDECMHRGETREAIGVALEVHRLDRIENAVKSCSTRAERITALNYCFDCAQSLVSARQYRKKVLRLIADLHKQEEQPDEVATAKCLAFIEDAEGLAETLKRLVASGDISAQLIALQIAFDVYENDTPRFSEKVSSMFPSAAPPAIANGDDSTEGDSLAKLRNVLSGQVPSALTLDFLSNFSKADGYILKNIKSALDTRSSACHSALIFTNAIMHAGTAIDSFLRENLDWLSRATSWAKFSATACLGVIHARHTASALNLLSPYLSSHAGSAYSEGGALYALGLMFASGDSQDPTRALPASTDGAVVPTTEGAAGTADATGAAAASTNAPLDAKEYLLRALQNANGNEVVQHGACLGLGLAALGSWDGVDDNEIYDELKTTLYTDSAVAGEAAGIAMGLVALGNKSDRALDEMFTYAQETEHEKIIRGLAMGMALVCYGREDEAEDIIQKMSQSKEPILRYGAMYAVALAYCGTADNKAIRHLLHMAVSDVSDDVRRAAVIALGFVLFRHPKQVPKIVALSADSCFPHVRYGAAMALGIACAGTGLPAASEILEHLATDSPDFVRQGALIALAMVHMQQSEAQSPKSVEVRKLFEKTIGEKHEDVMTKFGAVLATGIIDAGGRNSTIGLTSRSGHRRMTAIVGLALFTQYWYWFPMTHFIGLAFRPAALIAVNKNLKMPELELKCNAKPSLFAYPPMGPPEKPKTDAKAPVAVLSVTAKAMARETRRERKKAAGASSTHEAMEVDSSAEKDTKEAAAETPKERTEEPSSFMISNPSRVLDEQEKLISWPADGRYQPVKSGSASGFMLLLDTQPDKPETLVKINSFATAPPPAVIAPQQPSGTGSFSVSTSTASRVEDDGPEPQPPEAFDYVEE